MANWVGGRRQDSLMVLSSSRFEGETLKEMSGQNETGRSNRLESVGLIDDSRLMKLG
jgi:hypothetical protein